MKWLLTRGAKHGSARRYEEWLARLNIQSTVIAPGRGGPASLQFYSALLLTGGGDVNPFLYGQKKAPGTTELDDRRDRTESELIAAFLLQRKPVFAICRGLQILNVALRGGLIQHIPSYLSNRAGDSPEEHRKMAGKDSMHEIRLVEGTKLHAALGPVLEVNSAHHQALNPNRLGNDLCVAALSSPGGIIEAVEGMEPMQVLLGVQWHPERMPFEHPASSGLLRYMQELAARIGG